MNVFEIFAKISLDTSEYDKGLDGASGRTRSFGEKLKSGLVAAGKAGAAAIGAATAAAAGFAAASVKTGASFDSSMSQVAATMGTTVDKIQNLRDFAQEMGAKTAFSATEAADALNYMALAGYDAKKSMFMLPNVLNLAAAGGIDLASASDMVTDAQSALGLSMDETSSLVDKMAMASSKSNTSVAQLGEAILTVGGTAKNLAGGTTELSAALGILADNGVKGAEGGTALRNIILSLGAPTDKAAKSLEAMGVEVYDAEGKMRPLNETFGQLEAALSAMTQGEQTEVLSEIFNKVDLKSVNALLANTGYRFNELSGYIDKAKGSAEVMAGTQLDNLTGDITLFKSALEGAQIVLSDQLTPTLREFVQFGSTAVSTLSTAFSNGGLSEAMNALGSVLSDGINMLIAKLPDMVEAGMQLLNALGQGLLGNLPVITDAAVEIVLMLTEGIIGALPSLATGAVQIIAQLADGIGQALPALLPAAVEAILVFLEGLTNPESMNALLEGATQLIGGLIEGLAYAVPLLVEYAPEIIMNLIMGLVAALPKLIEIGDQLGKGLIQGLIESIKAIPAAIKKLFDALVGGIKALFGIHSPSTVFAEMGGQLIAGLLKGISDTWKTITGFFEKAAKGLIDFLAKAWETVHSGVTAAWNKITDVFKSAWKNIQNVWNSAASFFQGIWQGISGAFSGVASFFSGVFSSAWSAVRSAWSSVTSFFSGIASKIKSAFSSLPSSFASIGRNMMEGMKNGISNAVSGLVNAAKSAAKSALNAAKSALGIHSPSKEFMWLGEMSGEGLAKGIEGSLRRVSGAAGNLAGGLLGAWQNDMPDLQAQLQTGFTVSSARPAAAAASYGATINITVNGAQYSDARALAQRIAQEIQFITNRRNAYAPA
ncbi:MAG: phage tail tape measure protein [Provencibacterium sp.]|nr:phage tail tape measure protein [Provencibacterium sp.]